MSEESYNPPNRISLNVLPTAAQEKALAAMADLQAAAAAKSAVEVAPENGAPEKILTAHEKKLLEGLVIKAVRQIYYPEIPVSIYELGLIYSIDVADNAAVKIKMTLTAPACPVAGSLPGEVETKVEQIPEVKSADVELVWEPPWTKDRMSELARLTLDMM